MGLMLGVLNARGEVAVVGRNGKQRIWDLAERWYPETDRVSLADGEAATLEARQRAGSASGSSGAAGTSIPRPTTGPFPTARRCSTPFDRLIHDRTRAEALWDFRYRIEIYVPAAKREFGYYVLPLLVGDRIVGRAEPVFDRKAGCRSARRTPSGRGLDAPRGLAGDRARPRRLWHRCDRTP